MEFARANKLARKVSVIPLIDVAFQLMIFFMVAGNIEGIDILEVNPPVSASGIDKPNLPAVIYLKEDGRIAVNNDLVQKKDLPTIIGTLFINNSHQDVMVKSDAAVPAQTLVDVMNVIEEAGGTDVSLVTQVAKK